MLGLEQKFDLLLWSFVEYEEELLRLALHWMVWTGAGAETLREGWLSVNRRVLNLLAASRMYLDQLRVEISEMYGKDSPVYASLVAFISRQYDNELAYRAMEGLRNHAQHRSMPVGRLSYPMSVERDGPEVQFRYSVVPFLNIEELQQHGAVKATVLEELRATSGSQDPNLTPLLRTYTECLGRIHAELRRVTDSDLDRWERIVDAARERAREVMGDALMAVGVVIRDAYHRNLEEQYLWPNTVLDRKRLVSKSSVMKNLSKRYVSGAVDPADK